MGSTIKTAAKLIFGTTLVTLMTVVVTAGFGVRGVGAEVEMTGEDEEITVTSAAEEDQPYVPADQYQFTTQEGNNVTLLVRRAIQLFDLANTDIQMSAAQTIFTENNIVREINGQDLIYPGDVITVPTALVASYCSASQSLSTAQTEGWQYYADRANFDLGYISADNVALTNEGEIVPAVDGAPVVTSEEEEDGEAEDGEEAEFLGLQWYWWLGILAAGGAAVAVAKQRQDLNK